VDESRDLARLKELGKELGVGDMVTFLGARDQDRLQFYYSAAEVLVMPSNYESFGMVALEAMACGTPVIASEVGGLAYLVQDGVTGFHVPYRDPDELAGKISLLIREPSLRAEMSEAAVKHAQVFDWARIADQVLDVYEGLASSNSR
jgi:D-inositol-3-phosphate glycosyltransferase